MIRLLINEIIQLLLESISSTMPRKGFNLKDVVLLIHLKTMTPRRLLMLLFASLFIFSVGTMAHHIYQQMLNERVNREAQELFFENAPPGESRLTEPADAASFVNEPAPREISPAIAALQDINPEVVGWIRIAETDIDYPIVQGLDNQYYLDHDWKREKNRSGAIFMDYRNDPDALTSAETHTILYGHHMRDGSMFKQLMAYKDPVFMKDHPLIMIKDQYETHYYEVFSVYVSSADFYYIETSFATPMDYVMFIKQLQSNSMHPSDQLLTSHDQLLTLSTCTYEYNDARFVVHARRVDHLSKRGS